MFASSTIEILEQRFLYFDNILLYKSPAPLSDDKLLIQLLYLKYIDYIQMLDLNKELIKGIQFYRYDGNDRFQSRKVWSKMYKVYIHSDLYFEDLKNVYRAIGYNLKFISNNRHFSVTKYELLPLKRKLNKYFQYKLF